MVMMRSAGAGWPSTPVMTGICLIGSAATAGTGLMISLLFVDAALR